MISILNYGVNKKELKIKCKKALNKIDLYKILKENTTLSKNHSRTWVNKGKNVSIGKNTVIGADGFSIVVINGVPEKLPHIGNVVIGNNVDIGANVCIDRGTLDDTIIGNNVKIDNLVHISHNCKIGNNVVVGAGAIIGGSTIIEDNAIVHIGQVISSHSIIKDTKENVKQVCDTVDEIRTKLIITDLDKTLWGGVLGDVGYENIKIETEHKELQQKLKELSSRGVLLAISSKNNEDAAIEAIDKNKDMILRSKDFITWRINWKDKATNIKDILTELNLTEKGVIFIDDNSAERDLVSSILPDINTITEEDAQRLEMYKIEKDRQELKSKMNVEGWIKSLNLEINIEKYNEKYLDRVIQLLNKTNQMNLNKHDVSKETLIQWTYASQNPMWVVFVKDRFGDYGLTGFMRTHENVITNFVLSCRVMGRTVEKTLLEFLIKEINKNYDKIKAMYKITKYNKVCLDFFKKNFSQDIDNRMVRLFKDYDTVKQI